MNMTWGEFKQRMEAQGTKDDMTIEFIDIVHPNADHESTRPYAYIDKDRNSVAVNG